MNTRQLIILLILATLLSSFKNSGVQHEHIGNKNGLSNSAVTITYEDSRGYIWLGTWDGLNRYDGSDIVVYKPDLSKEGTISNNIIKNIFEDTKNNLWVVTENGINRYNYANDNFESHLVNYNTKEYKENLYLGDKSLDGSVYCLIKDIGFYKYNEKNKTFDILRSSTSKGIVNFFIEKNNNAYFILSNGMAEHYSLNPFNLIKEYNLNQTIGSENSWLVKNDSVHYLVYSPELGNLTFLGVETPNVVKIQLPSNLMLPTTINEAKTKGKFWIGCDNGEIISIENPGAPKPIVNQISLNNISELNIKIWNISETNPDLMWIGTDGNGVHKYSFNGKPFHSLTKGDLKKGNLSHNIVRAIIEDKFGNIYIGTRGAGLDKLINGRASKNIDLSKGLSNNAVLSLGTDKYENLWIGTDGEGIDMMDQKSGKIFHFPTDFENAPDLNFRSVYAICVDAFGDIWLGTSGYGIIQLNIKKSNNGYWVNHWAQFKSSNENGLISNIIYAIVEGEPNKLWIGSRGGGLQQFNTVSKKFQILQANGKDILNNNDVLSICYGSHQELWVGTSGGLNRINLAVKPHEVTYYSEYNGLANNTIHAIEQDKPGNIWVSTNKGLSKIERKTNSITNYFSTDGLSNFEYTDGASFQSTKTGDLYFGGINGIDWFHPDSIITSTHFPELIFTDFYINNEKQIADTRGSVLKKHIDRTDSLLLKHNQNFFSFSFTTLNFHSKTKTEYAYILENFYPEWTYIKNGRNISFTNVPPGKYTFRVRWTNEDGIWNKQEHKLFIEIKPAWYNTTLAYIAYYIIVLTLIILSFRIYSWRMKEKNKLIVQELKYQKLEEINTYKLQFFTNIAHEFRTPLTLIMAPTVSLLEKFANDTFLGPALKTIHDNSKRLVTLIAELTDFRKIETGNRHLKVQSTNLTLLIAKITDAFSSFANQNKVILKLENKNKAVWGWLDSNVVEKIVTNLISNAVKYTPEGGKVTIKIAPREKDVSISIIDTGIGIPKEVQEKIFNRFFYQPSELPKLKGAPEGSGVGLALTKSLIELHRGKIALTSLPGKGSTFEVTLPFQHDCYCASEISESQSVPLILDDPALDIILENTAKNNNNKSPSHSSTNILIVDDNYQIRDLLKNVLNEYHLFEAENGQDAITVLHENHIDMVISDIIMPIMDGLELCSYIKESFDTCHIPVILLTAKGSIEHRIEGIRKGADSYIPKPFDPRHVKARINQLIESRKKLRAALVNEGYIPNEFIEKYDSRDTKFIKSLNQFINKNIDVSELNSEMMMEELAVSKTQLYRKVKALTDLTPHGYLKKIRIKTASQLLASTDLSVSEIIDKTGFNNRTYFYRAFKEEYGKSPKDYIKSSDLKNL